MSHLAEVDKVGAEKEVLVEKRKRFNFMSLLLVRNLNLSLI